MELRQLKYFKEACERQNFSEAARILHISQSTLFPANQAVWRKNWMFCFSTVSANVSYRLKPDKLSCLMLHELSTMLKTGNKLSVI